MTDDFIKLLEQCPLHRRCPFLIRSVSSSYFSVARYYGGCKIQGEDYTYKPATDELIRNDVLQWIQKQIKATQKQKKHDARAVQPPDANQRLLDF